MPKTFDDSSFSEQELIKRNLKNKQLRYNQNLASLYYN